jgi:hypothetical protein
MYEKLFTELQLGLVTKPELQVPKGSPNEEKISSLNRRPLGHASDEPYPSPIRDAQTYEYMGRETYPEAKDALNEVVKLVPVINEHV